MEVLVVVLTHSSAASHTEPAAKPLLGTGVLGERGDRQRVGRKVWKTRDSDKCKPERKAWAYGKGNCNKIQLKN